MQAMMDKVECALWKIICFTVFTALISSCSDANENSTPVVNTDSYARLIVGVSPHISEADKTLLIKEILSVAFSDVPFGSRLEVYDAVNLEMITTFNIPNDKAYSNPKAKIRKNGSGIVALKRFWEVPVESDSSNRNNIQLPQFLEFVSNELLAENQTAKVVILGSPFYIDEREPSFTMNSGYVPSDGHLNASQIESIYGVKNRKEALKNVKVAFGFGDAVQWNSDLHRVAITRFWSLFISQQGGELTTFVNDPILALKTIGNFNKASRRNYQLDKNDNKLEMVSVRRAVDRRLIEDVFNTKATIATEPPRNFTGKIDILGIKWNCLQCDVDLYARAKPSSKFLYFGNKITQDGLYFKDHLTSPNPKNGLEYVTFKDEVDLRTLQIAINFYRGKLRGGPVGTLRIKFEGQIYTHQFKIKAEKGNKGQDLANMRNSPYWVIIDPLDVVRVR